MRLITQLTNNGNRRGPSVRLRSISCAVFALVLVVVSSACAQQSAGVLLQSGLYKEEVNGDLEAAIGIYERILKDFPKDRPVAAKALLHIGLCYEKLGKQEAQKAYQRLIKEFADQIESVAQARIRLSNLSAADEKAPSVKSTRQVWAKAQDTHGRISPDGRYLSYVNWTKGDLAVRDVETGENRDLTDEGTYEDEPSQMADGSLWSPDSRKIAYAWSVGKWFDLRIVGIDGSKPRVLCAAGPGKGNAPYPLDWSQDGKYILAELTKDGEHHIVLVSVKDGSVRTLKSLGAKDACGMTLSPDGRYVVYALKVDPDAKTTNIHILATDGSLDAPLVEHPALDGGPFWTPDGKRVLFHSNRSGSRGFWLLDVEHGRAQGAPKAIHQTPNGTAVLGFTQDGSFYYAIENRNKDVYVATLDLEAGEVLSPPTKISLRFEGSNRAPVWSPDGKRLAYFSTRAPHPYVLVVRSLETGQEREIPLQSGFNPYLSLVFALPQWSWDGRSIFVGGRMNDTRGAFRIDVETGGVTTLRQQKSVDEGYRAWPVFSRDDKTVYCVRGFRLDRLSVIVASDVKSGKDVEIYRAAQSVGKLALSPDGRQLAFCEKEKEDKFVLKTMPISGGKPREVFTVPEYESLEHELGVSWTSDGNHLVVAHPQNSKDLWVIPVDGGEHKTVKLGARARGLRLHPDGQRIAFTKGPLYGAAEIWALENFLPQPKPEKPSGMVVRRVWAEATDPDFMGAPSRDGKYLSYVDWETGDLAVRNLATGTNRKLTNEGWEKGWAQHSVFSPDSKQLAYYWWNNEKGEAADPELRIIGLDGAGPRIVPLDEGTYLRMPAAWSADGKQILALGSAAGKSRQILLIPVAGGKMRVLKTLPPHAWLWRYPSIRRKVGMSLSPDGRYVAYTYPAKQDSPECDIFLLAVDGSGETALVEHPADDFVLGWAPDGKRVVFASDRAGSMGIWVVEVADGKPQGTPHLLRPDVGLFHPMGFTPNGSYYYGVASGGNNIYVAPYDPQKGNITGEPVLAIKQYEGSNWAPDWSPDGRYLACVSERPGAGRVFLIQSVETGEVRELSPDLEEFDVHSLHWSSDGRSLLGTGRTKDFAPRSMGGILRIDVETGKVGTIAQGGQFPNVTSDGKTMFDVSRGHNGWWIWHHDLTTGDKYPVFRAKVGEHGVGAILGLVLSPDGKQLAFQDLDAGMVKVVPVAGGQPRELAEVEGKITIAWTPDGNHLLYAKRLGKSPSQLWRIGAEGGEPQKLDLTMPLEHIRFHPDGRRIAFTGKPEGDKCEVWVMENFLPESTAGK